MAYSEVQAHFEAFGIASRAGAYCVGDGCGGWHLSEIDVWVACSCNPNGSQVPHPEEDYPEGAEFEVYEPPAPKPVSDLPF